MKKLVVLLLSILLALSLSACGHEHSWIAATCTVPKTCSECGETEGEPLGHNWKDATCTAPKTCADCGETEGEPLGHSWKDATCTAPKTCARCGETEGRALGHDWRDATRTAPKTCARCGETEDEPLPAAGWVAGTLPPCGAAVNENGFRVTVGVFFEMLEELLTNVSSDFYPNGHVVPGREETMRTYTVPNFSTPICAFAAQKDGPASIGDESSFTIASMVALPQNGDNIAGLLCANAAFLYLTNPELETLEDAGRFWADLAKDGERWTQAGAMEYHMSIESGIIMLTVREIAPYM